MRKDMTAGAALIIAGLAFAFYSAAALPLGRLNQMGAGMFPMGLGFLLAFFGAGILLPSFLKDEALPQIRPRALIAILAAISFFALFINITGLMPVVIGTAVIASFSMPRQRLITTIALCVFLAFITWFIFLFLLKLQIPLIAWSL